MKIFVSYSRIDAGHFAQKIYRDLSKKGHNVFIDLDSIGVGEKWSNIIEDNISTCDIFVVIVTPEALESEHIEREVLQAQKENKKIIPCFYRYITEDEIKWNLNNYQGIQFEVEYDIALKLYRKITRGIITTTSSIRSKNSSNNQAKDKDNTLVLKDENSAGTQSYSPIKDDIAGEEIPISLNKQRNPYSFTSPLSFINKIQQQNDGNIYPERNTLDQPKPQTSLDVAAANNDAIINNNTSIKAVAKSYSFLKKWGSKGSGKGQFNGPHVITIDSFDNVYVADTYNHRVQKFDSNDTFITKCGSYGSGDGQFYGPYGITIDSSGNVYVAEYYNSRIQKFDSNCVFITKWGSYGSGDGQFSVPEGISVDSSGNVYVADTGNNRVQKFDSNGNLITMWGSAGSGNGEFHLPVGISIDSSGNVYVADTGNERIQKFDSNGNLITMWGTFGTGNGQFDAPSGISIDSSGNVYVSDTGNNRIQVFSPSTNR